MFKHSLTICDFELVRCVGRYGQNVNFFKHALWNNHSKIIPWKKHKMIIAISFPHGHTEHLISIKFNKF